MKNITLFVRITAGIVLAMLILCAASPTVRHHIHWWRYGYDRVWYHNRDYVDPQAYTAQETETMLGHGQKLVATGDKVIGLPVYDTPASLAFQKQRHVVSTLLFLKKPNGGFVVYELSGGP